MMMLRTLLISLFILALSACAPAATPGPSAPTTSAQSTPIDYQRNGGFIGANDHLTIDPNGHATLTRRNANSEFDLSRDQLDALQAAFQTASFTSLPENSMPQGVVNDVFNYVITYQGHTVQTADTAIPKPLEPVITLLNRIVDSNGK